jgi:hypothetical protein
MASIYSWLKQLNLWMKGLGGRYRPQGIGLRKPHMLAAWLRFAGTVFTMLFCL